MAGFAFDYSWSDGFDAPSFTQFYAAATGARGTAYAVEAAGTGRRDVGYYNIENAARGVRSTHYGIDAAARGVRSVAANYDAYAVGRRNCRLYPILALGTGRRGVAYNLAASATGRRNIETLYAPELRVYAAVDALPETDALIAAGTPPLETLADNAPAVLTVDLAPILQTGVHNYYFEVRRFNKRGIFSGGVIIRRRLDFDGLTTLTELPLPPSPPLWLTAAPYGNMGLRIQATYNYLADGTNAADTWYVWVQAAGPFIIGGQTGYPMTRAGGLATLDLFGGPYAGPSVLVAVGTYASGSGLWSGEDTAPGYLVTSAVTLVASGPPSPSLAAIRGKGVM